MSEATGSTAIQRLDFLDAVRGVAILLVVGVHAQGYALPLDPGSRAVVSALVNQVCVPLFFLVDGWIQAHRAMAGRLPSYGAQLRSSAWRLLLPWLIFTVAYGLARYLFERVGVLDSQIVYGAGAADVLLAAWGSVYTPQLYFLVSLFLIRLLNPLHEWLATRLGFGSLLAIALVGSVGYRLASPWTMAWLDIEGGQEPLLHALYNYQFYLLGLALRQLPETFARWRWIAGLLATYAVAATAFYALDVDSIGYYIKYPYLIATFLLATTGVFSQPWLLSLGRNTMPIFLLHVPIVMKLAGMLCAPLTSAPMVSLVLVWGSTMALTLALLWVIRKVPGHGLLFGESPPRGQ